MRDTEKVREVREKYKRYKYGKTARKKSCQKKQIQAPVADITEGMFTFFCPALKIRTKNIPCDTLKKRGDEWPAIPEYCKDCKGDYGGKWWLSRPDDIRWEAPYVSIRDYTDTVVLVALGKEKPSRLIEIREKLGLCAEELAEVIGRGVTDNGIVDAERGKIGSIFLSSVLGLPGDMRAVVNGDKIVVYQLFKGDKFGKSLVGEITP